MASFEQDKVPIEDDGWGNEEQVETEEELDTLDEPVWKTIGRDLMNIALKLGHVIFPIRGTFVRARELQDWDLWGPLFLSLLLAIILTFATSDSDQEALIFGGVFVIIWLGSAIITVNAILLGGNNIHFFQSVCFLGYCLGPLDIAAILCLFWDNVIFRLAVVAGCFSWSVFASWGFVAAMLPKEQSRTLLAIYPVVLFYLVIAWMILMVHSSV